MEFPCEIQTIINHYAKPAAAMTREDWREGSSIIKILQQDHWWIDYWTSPVVVAMTATAKTAAATTTTWTWVDWCKDKMIIGPPRSRSSREEAELDEDYLNWDDIIRHCRPWSKTWPAPDDRSWCTGPHKTTLPDWVKTEYLAAK